MSGAGGCQYTLVSTLVFSNHGELHAERVQDGVDRFEPRVRACTQGFVQALPAQSRIFGDLRYASCFGHVAERCDEYIGVGVLGGRRKIFRNHRIIIEIRRCVEWFVSYFLFLLHESLSLYPIGYTPVNKAYFMG